jgi:translation initiation factor 1A
MADDFGNEEETNNFNNANPGFTRVRLPRQNEILGIIEQRVGGIRMLVRCADGKTRNCRVAGRLKKKLWLREGDVVLIELWEFDKDRGDIIFKYTPSAVSWLKNKGYLKNMESEF